MVGPRWRWQGRSAIHGGDDLALEGGTWSANKLPVRGGSAGLVLFRMCLHCRETGVTRWLSTGRHNVGKKSDMGFFLACRFLCPR